MTAPHISLPVSRINRGLLFAFLLTAVFSCTCSFAQSAPKIRISPNFGHRNFTQSARVGSLIQLEVVYEGTGPFSVRWLHDGSPVAPSSSTTDLSSTLTLTPLRESDAGTYWAEVSNAAGTSQSGWASVVIVRSAASLTHQVEILPATPISRAAGASLSLHAVVSRPPEFFPFAPTFEDPVKYQWSRDGTPIPGATRAQFFVPRATTAESGSYQVSAEESGFPLLRSTPVNVAVTGTPPPAVPFVYSVSGLNPAVITTGQPFTIAAEIASTTPAAYAWFRDGIPLPEFGGPQLTIPHPYFGQAGTYSLVVSNETGAIQAFSTRLFVVESRRAPVFLDQLPAKIELLPNQTVVVTPRLDSDFPSAVQLLKSETPVSVQPWRFSGADAAGTYFAVASNAYGTTRSGPIVVTLQTAESAGVYAGTGDRLFGLIPDRFAIAAGLIAFVRPDRTATILSAGESRAFSRPFVLERVQLDVAGKARTPLTTYVGALTTAVEVAATRLVITPPSPYRPEAAITADLVVNGPTAEQSGYFRGRADGPEGGDAHAILTPDGRIVVVVAAAARLYSGYAQLRGTTAVSIQQTLDNVALGTLSFALNPLGPRVSGSIRSPDGSVRTFDLARVEGPLRSRLLNLASRGLTGTGDQAMIAGFTLAGSGSSRLLIRGVGPTLGAFGVADALGDTLVRVYRGSLLVAENDDWETARDGAASAVAAAAVGAFALPAGSRDAAVLPLLVEGNYTAHVSHPEGRSGFALAEIYNTSAHSSEHPQLSNLSLRGYVVGDTTPLIAGLVVDGPIPKRLLVRAIGPSLASFGVAGALRDPRLRIFHEDGLVGDNDYWSLGATPIESIAKEVGAFALPYVSRDAALLITLPPGNYTAQITGVDGAAGIALLESYILP